MKKIVLFAIASALIFESCIIKPRRPHRHHRRHHHHHSFNVHPANYNASQNNIAAISSVSDKPDFI